MTEVWGLTCNEEIFLDVLLENGIENMRHHPVVRGDKSAGSDGASIMEVAVSLGMKLH